MWQTLVRLLITLLLLGGALSNPSIAQQQVPVRTPSKAIAFVVPKTDHPNMSLIQKVQDPYCPGGSSACQGRCETAAGIYDCSPGGGGPGDCVPARKCE
jgi:hypothetical protein